MKLSIDARKDEPSVTAEWNSLTTPDIDGVVTREAKPVVTGNGMLIELVRGEWLGDVRRIDQVTMRTIDPGGVSAWHVHQSTTDRLCCVSGRVVVVLYDARATSPTHGTLAEYKLAPHRPTLLIVPPGVFHGVKALGQEPALVINMVDEAYSYATPDHWRLPQDAREIPYRFE